jgi:hypothetical protein
MERIKITPDHIAESICSDRGMFYMKMECEIIVMGDAYASYYHCDDHIFVVILVSSKKGDGKKLLEYLADEYSVIRLECLESEELMDYYMSLGFKQVDDWILEKGNEMKLNREEMLELLDTDITEESLLLNIKSDGDGYYISRVKGMLKPLLFRDEIIDIVMSGEDVNNTIMCNDKF